MTTTVSIILSLLITASVFFILKYRDSLQTSPVVLNSLPRSVIKCDDSALPEHCTKWNITVKEYEAGQ